jgi:hypothetical protein
MARHFGAIPGVPVGAAYRIEGLSRNARSVTGAYGATG